MKNKALKITLAIISLLLVVITILNNLHEQKKEELYQGVMLKTKISNNYQILSIINQNLKEDIINLKILANESISGNKELIEKYTEITSQQNQNIELAKRNEAEITELLNQFLVLRKKDNFYSYTLTISVIVNAFLGILLVIKESQNKN